VRDDVHTGLRVVLRQSRAPLEIGDERRAELRVVGQLGVVGREAHQRREAKALIRRDREVAVLCDHLLVAAELV